MSQAFLSFSQQSSNLTFEKGQFYIDGERSTLREFIQTMKVNEDAYSLATKAKTNYDLGTILGYTGGILIAWPLGQGVREKDPNWNLAIAGGALLIVGFPVISSAYNKLEKALNIYNSSSSQKTGKLDLKIMPSKVGLVYSF